MQFYAMNVLFFVLLSTYPHTHNDHIGGLICVDCGWFLEWQSVFFFIYFFLGNSHHKGIPHSIVKWLMDEQSERKSGCLGCCADDRQRG